MLTNEYIRVVVANESTGNFVTGFIRPNYEEFVALFDSSDLKGENIQIGKYQYFIIFDAKRQRGNYPITAMSKSFNGFFKKDYKPALKGSFVITQTDENGRPTTLTDDEINNVMKHLIITSDRQRTKTFPVVEIVRN